MPETERDLKVRDVVNAAAIVTEAVQNAPGRTLSTVESALAGEADVILDDAGADVVLHEADVTVHVRLAGAENEG